MPPVTSELPVPSTAAGRDGLAALRAHPERAVLAFDFDGTLAPIAADPEQVRAHPSVVPMLARLAPALRSVAVITGRSAEAAVRLGGFAGAHGLERLVVLGGYGAERWDAKSGEVLAPPVPPGVVTARAELPEIVRRVTRELEPAGAGLADRADATGAWIEDKGRALAVHTRRASDPHRALEALRAPLYDLAARCELTVEPGRLVLELRPPGMDKGEALTSHVREMDAGVVVFGGDDLGDLAAFEAVEALRREGLPGLLVCSRSAEVSALEERADVVVDGPAGVAALLSGLADLVWNPRPSR